MDVQHGGAEASAPAPHTRVRAPGQAWMAGVVGQPHAQASARPALESAPQASAPLALSPAGERHGTPAERLLAAQMRANQAQQSRPHTLFATGPKQQPQPGPPSAGPMPMHAASGFAAGSLPPPPGMAMHHGMPPPPAPWAAQAGGAPPPWAMHPPPAAPWGMPPPPMGMGMGYGPPPGMPPPPMGYAPPPMMGYGYPPPHGMPPPPGMLPPPR
jgi:splicing factor 3B subunit 4